MRKVVSLEKVMYEMNYDLPTALDSISSVEPFYRGEIINNALGNYLALGDIDSAKKLQVAAAVANNDSKLRVKELEGLVRTDPLTGLFNRRAFEEASELLYLNEKRMGNSMAVLMIDGDYFKSVNDTYGHDVGDKVLKYFAKTFKDNVRKSDIVARHGGEEFVVFLSNTNLEGALKVGNKINSAIRSYSVLPDGKKVTVSIGAAELKDVRDAINEGIKSADDALCWMKDNNRDGTAYFSKGFFKKSD